MIFRYARHTNQLESLINFYTQILNFDILGSFQDHDGYDGVFLGKNGEKWHLEFTQSSEEPKSVFDEDDILVFYPESTEEFEKITENLKTFNVPLIEPKNPYWKENGICFEDSDYFKIIVSKQKLNP